MSIYVYMGICIYTQERVHLCTSSVCNAKIWNHMWINIPWTRSISTHHFPWIWNGNYSTFIYLYLYFHFYFTSSMSPLFNHISSSLIKGCPWYQRKSCKPTFHFVNVWRFPYRLSYVVSFYLTRLPSSWTQNGSLISEI